MTDAIKEPNVHSTASINKFSMLSVRMFKINEIMMIKISIDANRGERGGFEGLPRNPPLIGLMSHW